MPSPWSSTHDGPMPERNTTTLVASLAVAAAIGAGTWMATMASAPRYSFGAEQDMGSSALYYVLLGTALVGGALVPRSAGLFGMALGLPPLLLSPWTAPRGDNDGLWVLIVPYLGLFVLVLAATAGCGAWLRERAGARIGRGP